VKAVPVVAQPLQDEEIVMLAFVTVLGENAGGAEGHEVRAYWLPE